MDMPFRPDRREALRTIGHFLIDAMPRPLRKILKPEEEGLLPLAEIDDMLLKNGFSGKEIQLIREQVSKILHL